MAKNQSGAMTTSDLPVDAVAGTKKALRAAVAPSAMLASDKGEFERDEGPQRFLADARERSGGAPVRRAIPILLLTEQEAAEALGVSHRKFQELRDADWCPKPIVLGPRLLRWSRAELEEAVCRMPRQSTKFESVRDRIASLKSRGVK